MDRHTGKIKSKWSVYRTKRLTLRRERVHMKTGQKQTHLNLEIPERLVMVPKIGSLNVWIYSLLISRVSFHTCLVTLILWGSSSFSMSSSFILKSKEKVLSAPPTPNLISKLTVFSPYKQLFGPG